MVADRQATIAIVAALVAAAGVAPAAGAPPDSALERAGGVDPDTVVMEASLHPDGAATWRVKYLVRLDDENATRAFESLREDIRTNESAFVSRFADRMRDTVASAENATGREMAVRNVSVRTAYQNLGQRYGVVIYRFSWEGFAVANDTSIRAGDALAGLFLDAETTLRMSWPAGYRVAAVEPAPDERPERAVVWNGRRDFGAGEPLLVVTTRPTPTTTGPATTTGPGPTTAPGAGTETGTEPGDSGETGGGGGLSAAALVAIALAVIAAVGGASWLYVRRSGAQGGEDVEGDDGDGDGGGGGGEPPEELLSNEERVLKLLEERGGRMKQQQVVEELGWTDAKTSQVVRDLRESGEIDAFRLGRENVLSLPGEDDT